MQRFLLQAILFIVVVLFSTGCVNRATATPYPAADIAKLKTVYVKKLPADGRGINELIADKFISMGYQAHTGTEVFPQTDIVVTYADKWMWDITMYMLELTIVIREPGTDYPIATGNSLHSSLTRKSPKEMVNEVIDNIFKPKGSIHAKK